MVFTQRQQVAYNALVRWENVFITGPAGTGKSHVVQSFVDNYKKTRTIALTSTTGTSALLIHGTTLHSYLGIGLGKGTVQTLVEKIHVNPSAKKRWLKLDCLIIDEVSMLDGKLFNKLDKIGQSIRNIHLPFGGIQLVCSGDFLQLPCIGDSFCFQSSAWSICIDRTVYLTEIIRQRNTAFQTCLNNVRLGNVTDEVKTLLQSRVGVGLDTSKGIIPTRLFSVNAKVDTYNDRQLDNLNAELLQYDTIYDTTPLCTPYVLDKYKRSNIIPDELVLCEGAQVMLCRNLDMENGLVNGSRGVVTRLTNDDIPIVRFLNGMEKPIGFHTSELLDEYGQLILTSTQVPLKVAYAISIHKSQGCSLDYVEMDLRGVFEYGQAYVALSRTRSLDGLNILGINYQKIVAHPLALEYYKQLADSIGDM